MGLLWPRRPLQGVSVVDGRSLSRGFKNRLYGLLGWFGGDLTWVLPSPLKVGQVPFKKAFPSVCFFQNWARGFWGAPEVRHQHPAYLIAGGVGV